MKTRNIFKTLAMAMLMPTMLLTASCSNEDIALNNTAENTAQKGYTLPVTVSVTRQGDAATTRASYNETDKKLEFTEGDKLFVKNDDHDDAGEYAGTLEYDAVSGKFSGTITTEKEFTGTTDELLAGSSASLLPKGYDSYGFLSLSGSGYSTVLNCDNKKAFAPTKAEAVEQFSDEYAEYESGTGYALIPYSAILNFTITGLTASTEVAVSLKDITGNVTTAASGKATFAIGLADGLNLKNYPLTVGGTAITLVSESKTLAAGKIYNISRSALTYPTVTAPTAKTGLKYTGSAQELVTAGSATGGTMKYSLDGTNWSETIPTGKNAGSYTVYYKVVGNTGYEDVEQQTLQVAIAKADLTYTAPTLNSKAKLKGGSVELLSNTGSVTGGTMYYRVENANTEAVIIDWSTTSPTVTSAGEYGVKYKIVPNDPDNYNGVDATAINGTVKVM